MPLNVALIASEIYPYAKTGGLADMVGAMARLLESPEVSVRLILPRYRQLRVSSFEATDISVEFPLGEGRCRAQLWRCKNFHRAAVYAIDIPEFFDRPGLYGEEGHDYADNAVRFIAFSRAALACLKALGQALDVVHVHDWQTALIPFYLKTHYAADPMLSHTRSILTVHNLSYQGLFPAGEFALTGLPQQFYDPRYLEFFGQCNFLKAGLVSADWISTVSPSYAAEIMTPAFGCGLDGLLKERATRLSGILNGIDTIEWDPTSDHLLTANFSSKELEGKQHCKLALQEKLQLSVDPQRPLFAMIARFVEQKGIDQVAALLPTLSATPAQWVFLGQGEKALEDRVKSLAARYPERVVAEFVFDEALAHQIEAGADFFLMPSRYEPCGLNQLYSLRYGTIPIVRAVGGLKDTVVDLRQHPDSGTGFVFSGSEIEGLAGSIHDALQLYRDTSLLERVRRRGMERDLSWKQSVNAYKQLYRHVLAAEVSKL